MSRVLVAGVGNLFLSDDGFGSEVVREMAGRAMPDGVEIVDFGIRGVHLAYQLLDGYDTLVVVDAAPTGRAPGTVSVLEVDQSQVGSSAAAVSEGQAPLVDSHGLEPGAVLAMLGSLGGSVGKVLVVACEPETTDEGIGLSEPVWAAIPAAIEAVQQVVHAETSVTKEVSK